MSGLHFDFTGNPSGLVNAANQSRIAIQGITDEADKAGMKIDEFLGATRSFVTTIAGFGMGAAGIKYLGKRIVDVRSEFQNTEAMFKVFLKSGEAAESLMERMRSYAFNNVFDLSRLSQASAQLLAYGTDVDVVIDKLDNLSNIAAGTNKPLEELVGVYNKVKSTNIIDSRTELSLKNMGVNVREILEQSRQLEKGTLSGVTLNFKDLDDAIQAATHNGGMFEGMMEAKMETLGDKVGLLQDKIQNVFNDVGTEIQEPMGEVLENVADMLEDLKEPLTDVVKAGVEGAKFITEHWKEIALILGTIAAQYGTLKATMAMDKAFKNASRMQLLKAEEAQLIALQQQYKKLREEMLKSEVQKLRSKGKDATVQEMMDLNAKEQELIKLRSEIASAEADNSMSAKQKYEYLNEAYGKYVDGLSKYVQASGALNASIIQQSEADIAKTEEELKVMLEKENAYNGEIQLAYESLEAAKAKKSAAEENITSINEEMAALENLIKVRQQKGMDTSEEEAMGAELQKRLSEEANSHNAAVQEMANARTAINTAVTQSNTISKEANAKATELGAKAQKLANIQIDGATLRMKVASASMKVASASMKLFRFAIMQVKAAWQALKASMMSNPIGWIGAAIEGVAALGAWLSSTSKKEDKVAKQQKALNDAIRKSEEQGFSEIGQLDILINRMKAAGEGTEEYTKLRLKLINQFGKYGDLVSTETAEIVKLGDAYDRLRGYILSTAKARGKEAYEQEIQNKLSEGYKDVYKALNETGDILQFSNKVKMPNSKEYSLTVKKLDEETANQIKAHMYDVFESGEYKTYGATSGEEMAIAFTESFEKKYNKEIGDIWGKNMGRREQDEFFYALAELQTGELGEIQRQLDNGDNIWNIGDRKGEAEREKFGIEAQKEAYITAVGAMNDAYKVFSEDATEENKQTYESLKQTAENALSQYKLMVGGMKDSLTFGEALDEEKNISEDIVALQNKIFDAKVKIKNGTEEEKKEAQEVLDDTQAQLNIEEARLEVVKKTIEEYKKNPRFSYRIDMSLEDIKAQRQALEKELTDIWKQTGGNNMTVEQVQRVEAIKQEQEELNKVFKLRIGISDAAWNEYKARQSALAEEQKLNDSRLKTERQKIEATKKQALQQLKLSNEEYKRNNGKNDPTYSIKRKNILLKAQIDTEELERKYNEWKRNHERETIHLQMDIEMEALQRDLENATTAAERNAAKAAIRTAEDNRMKSENREKADDEIKSKLGGSLESLEAYTQNKGKSDAELADILGIDAETVTQLRQIEEHYANILTLQQAQKAGQRGQEDLHQQVSDLESYMKTATQLTSDYENTLENIRAKYNIREYVDMHTAALPAAAAQERDLAKSILDQQMAKNGQDNGIVDAEGDIGQLIQQINDITVNVAAKTTEEIVTLYQQVLDELNGELEELNTQISADKTTLETGQELNEETGQMEDITPERRLEIEQEMNQLIAERQVLTQMQSDVQAKANEAASQSLTAQQKRMQQFDTTSDHLINGFASLNQSAKTISATFGGALSKKGKKAMQAIEGISDAAGNALSGLKTMIPAILTLFTSVGSTGTAIQTEEAAVSTGTSAAITGTSTAAATAIRTVETASVILAVISAALQIIQAIVNVVMQFNEAQQMQDAIDEDIERVEALKREQEALNKAFEREAGTAYYKGMSKAAKNYYNLILAQEKTVADARALYQRQAEKYGEDSDKAKDAKKQYEEQLDALEEFKDEQQEMFDEMAQDLLTTDLSSFAENLADQYIEGFEQGMDGINGVFDSVMNDLQKNMMKKGLSIALENLFKDTWDRIKAMTEDGDLTTSEMDAIMAEMDAKAAQSKQIAEQYYNAMSERGLLGDEDVETSSGGFDAMTQDQADTLSARFTALQIEGANVVTATQAMMTIMEQLGVNDAVKTSTLTQMLQQFTLAGEVALQQLDELRKISENTSTLADTNRRLRAIEDNTNSLRE